jgi:hypothetical protein
MNELQQSILDRRQKAEDYLRVKRGLWTEYENILHGYLTDDISSKTRSQMFDPKLATISLDRSARVMAQLATGKVKGISKNDAGGEKLMNLILDKYVIPNANSQFDFLTKCRMMNLYSNIYGNFFALIDWESKKNGYVGPDMWLIPIRDVFPQVGAVSLEDSDYMIIRSWHPRSYFEGLTKEKGYKNVGKILEVLDKKSGSKESRGQEQKTAREMELYADETAAKKAGYFETLSMYEKDRWVDFSVDAQVEYRDQANPQENDELPIVNKYSIPLLDDFMGMGDYERGKKMQYGLDSLWNLYMDAVRVSIFPPILINEDNVSDASSIKWAAAAKWMMKNAPGSPGTSGAQSLNLSPQGTNTFQAVYGAMSASLLNMFGTTDTTVTQQTDPNFGKTPQALKMQAQRENARDTVDRFYTERFITNTMKKFVNLVSKKMSGAVAIRMFEGEIEELSKSYKEIEEMYDEKTGKLNIPKSKFGSVLYDYEIVPGSTYAVDQKQQQDSLVNLFGMMSQNLQVNPQSGEVTSPLVEALKKEEKQFKFGEALERIIANSGVQDWDKIVVDTTDDIEGKMQADQQKLAMIIQSMTAQNVNGIPTPPQQGQPIQGQPVPQTQPVPLSGGQMEGQINGQ